MGCDIHTIVQVRHGDTWATVTPPADLLDEYGDPQWEARNYVNFGILAGVRDHDVTPIVEPRGLPDDLDVRTEQPGWGASTDAWAGDDYLGEHNHSWVTARELADYDFTALHPDGGFPLADAGLPQHLAWLLSLADDPSDVRLVFGFDS